MSSQAAKPISSAIDNFDVRTVFPFIQATIDTLRVQCKIVVRPGKPYFKTKSENLPIDIAAVVGLASRTLNGSVAICFTKKMFLAIMGSMLDEKFEEITKEMQDGAAELLNIIFGQAKKMLNDKGYEVERAIPTIIRGDNITVTYLTTGQTIVLPFDTNLGPFHIEITTEQPGKKY
ncbi:MAG: chemotaxis protein CheX [Deltaproteobacteria bacterium]|nr:chemotaxis protein CheX [Deltaproteobacteria bacterium]